MKSKITKNSIIFSFNFCAFFRIFLAIGLALKKQGGIGHFSPVALTILASTGWSIYGSRSRVETTSRSTTELLVIIFKFMLLLPCFSFVSIILLVLMREYNNFATRLW
jgi:hypothetical protein